MIVDLDLDDCLDRSDVLELCEEWDIDTNKLPECFEGIDFTKLAAYDMMKMELFLQKFEGIDLATFEKFLNSH